MRRSCWLAIVLVAGCGGSPPPPPSPPAPIDAAPAAIPTLSVRHANQLCIVERGARACAKIGWQANPTWTFGREPIRDGGDTYRFRLGGKPCTLAPDDRLDCGLGGGGTEVQTGWDDEHGYVHGRLAGQPLFGWFSPGDALIAAFQVPHEPPELHAIGALTGGIDRLSIGYRVACALTGGAVWCWSDPRAPRKLAAPRDVVDLFVQDLFVACVRTGAGEVHCTPPDDSSGVVCDPDKAICAKDNTPNLARTGFDPVTRLQRAMQRVPLPHAATRFVRDAQHLHVARVDNDHVSGAETLGGCAIGPANEVSCFAPCQGKAWGVIAVAGLPAGLTEVQSDVSTGYALTERGELWTWNGPREPACNQVTSVAAARVAIAPLVQLADPLHHVGKLPAWTMTRCAVTRTGPIECWSVDKRTGGVPATRFDPRTLPAVKVL